MKKCPLVTIAIPTYNRAGSYLGDALRSALEQTYGDIEVVVSDNCSADRTEELVRGFGDARIRYFRQERNIGANNNFNFCISRAEGDYFLLLQDDDMIDRDFIETCINASGCRTDVGLIRTGTRVINARNAVIREYPNHACGGGVRELIRAWYGGKTALYLCSTLFNTRGLRDVGGFGSPKELFQDVAAELKLAASMGRVDVHAIKASFRKHQGEMTFAAKIDDWCDDSLYLLDLMCDLARDDVETVRREGLKFLAKLNYCRASSIRSPIERVTAYMNVSRKFGHAYSLFSWLLRRSYPYRVLSGISQRLSA